jgi:hypothetical protein
MPHEVMGATPVGGYDLPPSQQWPSTGRQMNGTAFAIVKLIYSRQANTTSMQPITFAVGQNSSGLDRARAGDVWFDYMTNAQYGGAIDPIYVDTATRDALNTYGDELITFTDYDGNPATQRRYKINGLVNAGQSVLTNVDTILTACDSWMAYSAVTGKWSIIINKEQSTAYAFDDNNIIGEVRVSATDITSSTNAIEAKFPNSQNKDQPAYINISTPSGLLYPNEPVNKLSINFDMVNNSVQAHYLANRILEQAREDLIVSFSTTYYGIQVDAGDVVSVTNSGYGWTNKLFRVMRVNEVALSDGSLGAKLNLSEYNAQVYDNQDINQFSPVPNGNIASPSFFSALTFPTVTGYPTATVPNFSVAVGIPATGRVTAINLFFTTAAVPTPSDWKLLTSAYVSNATPYTPSGTYTFTNLILSAGSYLFAYTVGNENSQSSISGASSLFVWSPIAPTGPTGPTGTTGPTGGAGTQGTRSASGYIYYDTPSASAPATPTASGFNFTTGTFTTLTAGWTTTFSAPAPSTNPATQAGSKFWAVRYAVSEATYGGTQTVTLSSPFNWQNLDGLVTFTNVTTNSGTTFIDGGNIVATSITVNKLVAGLLQGYTFRTGSGHTPNGFAFEVNSAGTVWADNLFSGVGYFANSYYTSSNPLVAYSYGNIEGFIGAISAAGTGGSSAHGIRGANYKASTTTSGLVGAANGYDFYADGAGTNYGPFTGTHDSLVPIGTTFTVGDIVVDQEIIAKNGVSSTIALVANSTLANQQGGLGVVCGLPSALSEQRPSAFIESIDEIDGKTVVTMKPSYYTSCDTYNFMPINAVGEGQINVCGEGGNIAIGDLICSSNTKGKGMKQSDDVLHTYTIAKAREAVTFISPDQIIMIACIYVSG